MGTLTIRGNIRLPGPTVLGSGALAIVGLDDVGLADAPSKRVAEATIRGIAGMREAIPFCLRLDESLLVRGPYVLAAEVRHAEGVSLQPGDFLSTTAHPWEPRAREEVIELRRV